MATLRIFCASCNSKEALGMSLRLQLFLFVFIFVCLFVPILLFFQHPLLFMALLNRKVIMAHDFFCFTHQLLLVSPSWTLGRDWEGSISWFEWALPRNLYVNVLVTSWWNSGKWVDPEVFDFITGLIHCCFENISFCLSVCLCKCILHRETCVYMRMHMSMPRYEHPQEDVGCPVRPVCNLYL